MVELLMRTKLCSIPRKKRKVEKEVDLKQNFNTNFIELFDAEKKLKEEDVEKYNIDKDISKYFDEVDGSFNEYSEAKNGSVDEELIIFEELDKRTLELLGGFIIDDPSEMLGPKYDSTSPSNEMYSISLNSDENEELQAIQESLALDESKCGFDADSITKEFYDENLTEEQPVVLEKQVLTVFQYHQLTERYNLDPSRVNGSIVKNLNFLGAIAPNSLNSCYVDATFELLWNAVLPFVSVETINYTKNAFDNILIMSYTKYIKHAINLEQKKKYTLEASNMIINFVWSIPNSFDDAFSKAQFIRGESNYVMELFQVFFRNMSDELKSLICGFSNEIVRSYICSNDENHSRMEYQGFPDAMLGVENNMRDSLSAEKSYVGEKELDEEFNSIFLYQTVIREKRFRCDSQNCTGIMTARNIIDPSSTPPFLFISDPTNFMQVNRMESNIYFPETITIYNNIHGRVYSTSSDGSHFFTVCYKIIDNKSYLVRIDNLNSSIRIITSNMEKARQIIRKYPKTSHACYKKRDFF